MAGAVAALVPAKPSKRLDLRGNNRLRHLLEVRAEQAAIIHEATQLKKEAEEEIKEIIGDAHQVRADGYWINYKPYTRPAYTVKEAVVRTMRIVRSGRW